MADDIPRTGWERGLCAGKTAARMGGKTLGYLSRAPFQTRTGRTRSRQALNRESAALLFQGLGLLRGVALKAAQLLSLEADLLPPEITRELGKSCYQVPPINRALARKVVSAALGMPPEEAFKSFDAKAFAAASLGQVHRAVSRDGRELAVKLQYPGIRQTIETDLKMLRAAMRPLADRQLLATVLDEIEARLLEEVDYRRERENMAFFRRGLRLDRVRVPNCREDLSADTVLCADYLDGLTLIEWLQTGPTQHERDQVAQTLQDVFVASIYGLRAIHADPNPGNFLVFPDLRVGLVDFGCVKHFDERFVTLYGKLPATAMRGGRDEYLALLSDLQGKVRPADPEREETLYQSVRAVGEWLCRLYREERFDFRENQDFIAAGKRLMFSNLKQRAIMDINPDFVFLDRTRYGLLKLFERMGARVRFRNEFEHQG